MWSYQVIVEIPYVDIGGTFKVYVHEVVGDWHGKRQAAVRPEKEMWLQLD